jgi:hypothetical protein
MSALLLGATVSSLTPENQTALVWFVILFPCFILLMFGWLVSRHHRKLYGPSDYRTDESFLTAGAVVPPASLGSRLRNEIAQAEAESTTSPMPLPSSDTAAEPINKSAQDEQLNTPAASSSLPDRNERKFLGSPSGELVTRAYVAENLVFQELQSELGGSVARNIAVATDGARFEVDGIVRTKNGDVIVEVKRARSEASVRRIAHKGAEVLATYQRAARAAGLHVKDGYLVIVVDNKDISSADVRALEQSLLGELRFTNVRVYSYYDLLAKYGLSSGA